MHIRFVLMTLVGPAFSLSLLRAKRFLNAEVHNRIDVLEQSHATHLGQTTLVRNVGFGAIITLSILFLVSIFGLVFLCVRFRTYIRRNLSPSVSSPTAYSSPTSLDLIAVHQLLRTMNANPPTHLSSPVYYPPSRTTNEASPSGMGLAPHPLQLSMLKF